MNVIFQGDTRMWHGSNLINQRKRTLEDIVKKVFDMMFEEHRDIEIVLSNNKSYSVNLLKALNYTKSSKLRIMLWSTLVEEEGREVYLDQAPIGKLWGRSNCLMEGFYIPLGKGRLIFSPEGLPVAEYFEEYNVLFILFDIIHHNSPEESYVFEKILEELRKIYASIHNINVDEIKEKQIERERIAKEKRLLEFFTINDSNSLLRLKEDLEVAILKMNQARSKYIHHYREVESLKNSIINSTQTENTSKERYKNMINDFYSLDKIKDIDFINERKFIIKTNTLYAITDESKRYLMGEYNIEVDINNGYVRFLNINNRRRSYWSNEDNHPHVADNGEACLGNVATVIADLIAQREWYVLATILINFLENVNINDPAGKYVINWDEVDESGNIIKEGLMDDNPSKRHCDYCNEIYEISDEQQCYECEEQICPECRVWDDLNNEYYCKDCYSDLIEAREEEEEEEGSVLA